MHSHGGEIVLSEKVAGVVGRSFREIGRGSIVDRGDRSPAPRSCLKSKHVGVFRRMDENRYPNFPVRPESETWLLTRRALNKKENSFHALSTLAGPGSF